MVQQSQMSQAKGGKKQIARQTGQRLDLTTLANRESSPSRITLYMDARPQRGSLRSLAHAIPTVPSGTKHHVSSECIAHLFLSSSYFLCYC